MRRRSRFSLFPVALCLLITAIAWPVFVACATVIGYLGHEAWQLDAWSQEPKQNLLALFLDGWVQSLPIAIGLGVLAAIDWLLLARVRLLNLIAGILLPIAGAVFALVFWHEPMDLLPTLLSTGLVLALIYRLSDIARGVID